MTWPEIQQQTEQEIQANEGIKNVNELKSLIDSKNASEINQQLNASFLENLKSWLHPDTAMELKTAIEDISGYNTQNSELNNVYEYVVDICNAFNTENEQEHNIDKKINITDILDENIKSQFTKWIQSIEYLNVIVQNKSLSNQINAIKWILNWNDISGNLLVNLAEFLWINTKADDKYNKHDNKLKTLWKKIFDMQNEKWLRIYLSNKYNEMKNNDKIKEFQKAPLNSIPLQDMCNKLIGINWDGKNLNEEDNNIQDFCKKWGFDTTNFVQEFNNKNQERINKSIDELKNFDITSVLKDKLSNITIKKKDESEEEKLVIKEWDNNNELTVENMVKLLGLEDKAKTQFSENLGKTNFVNESELINLINSNDNIKNAWLGQIKTKVKSRPPEQQPEPETPTTNELRELQANDITNIRKYVKADNVANFFNEAIKKENLTEEQKGMLLLAQKWLVTDKLENNDIKSLQIKLWFNENAVDWKFGIKTFNALRQKFGNNVEKNIQTPTSQQSTKKEKDTENTENTEKTQEEVQKQILNNIKWIYETTLNDNQKIYYWIKGNTQIYQKNGFNWIYYFNNNNELLYMPNPNNTTLGNIYNKKIDTVPLIRKTTNGINRTKEYPSNCNMFKVFLYEKLRQHFPNNFTKADNTKIEYDTNKWLFTLSNHWYKSYITKDMLEWKWWSQEIGKQLWLLSLQNFLIKKLIDNQPNYKSNELVISKNNNTSKNSSGFEANRYKKDEDKPVLVGKRNIESKYIKKWYLDWIDTESFFQSVVNLPEKKLQKS